MLSLKSGSPRGVLIKADQKGTWLQPTAGRHSPEPFWVPETLPAVMAGGANTASAGGSEPQTDHAEVSGGYMCLCAHGTIG